MKYLFHLSEAYSVEAENEQQALDLIENNLKKYRAGWREWTLVEEEGETEGESTCMGCLKDFSGSDLIWQGGLLCSNCREA